jgi:hypothetical protein
LPVGKVNSNKKKEPPKENRQALEVCPVDINATLDDGSPGIAPLFMGEKQAESEED